jgi:hypothetical protein
VLEDWSTGVLECWSAGVLECWSAGVLECWSAGVCEEQGRKIETENRIQTSRYPGAIYLRKRFYEYLALTMFSTPAAKF